MRNTTLNTKSLNLTLIAGAFALALMAPVHAQVVGGVAVLPVASAADWLLQ